MFYLEMPEHKKRIASNLSLAGHMPLRRSERTAQEDKMKPTLWFLTLVLALEVSTAWAGQSTTQPDAVESEGDVLRKAEQSAVLILVGDGAGRVQSVSAGVVIRSDGIVLTAYSPVKGAQEVQVRLGDGEVYDQVDLVGFDERRNVATLHIPASGLAALPAGALGEVTVGEKVHVLVANGAMAWALSDGVLGPVRLADEVLGAGQGYRVIQFMAALPAGALGGALFNSNGQLLGIFTGSPNTGGQQFAVPVESVSGLAAQTSRTRLGPGKNLDLPQVIPNQGGAPVEEPTPIMSLAKARSLRVSSRTTYFTPFMLQKELLNKAEFRELGMNVIDGSKGGDLLVEVDRPLFTYDFTYSVADSRTGAIVATGKVTAIDGPHAAQGIARKIVQEVEKARAVQAAQVGRQ